MRCEGPSELASAAAPFAPDDEGADLGGVVHDGRFDIPFSAPMSISLAEMAIARQPLARRIRPKTVSTTWTPSRIASTRTSL